MLVHHRLLAGSTYRQFTVWARIDTMRRSGFGAHEDSGFRVIKKRPP